MSQTPDEELRRKRRRRLIRGLVMGGAAVGVPALVNALVSRRAGKLPAASWGRGETTDSKHGKIHYQRLGAGAGPKGGQRTPVLLLHSFGPGHSGEEWRQVAERLAGEFEVFVPDLLGWGRSDKPSLTYDSELYIELIGDVARGVAGEHPVVVAAGLPAAYAVQLAVDQPSLIRALALIVPLGIELAGDEPDFKDALMHRLLRLPVLGTSALNVYTSRKAIAAYLRQEVFAAPEKVADALVDRHYRSSHQTGSHGALAAYLSGYLNHSVREILDRVDVPVWLGWGRRSATPPVESADLWLRSLRNAELEVFEDSGMWPHAESAEALARKLERFLTDLGD